MRKSPIKLVARVQLLFIRITGGLVLKLASWANVLAYRWSRGLVGGKAAGLPVLLLTTTGRKSGKRRTRPLGYLEDGHNYVVIGSNAGQSRNPAWVLNLQSDPQATVQVKGARIPVVAVLVGREERRRIWAEVVSRAPIYDSYQNLTEREIPLVFLRPKS